MKIPDTLPSAVPRRLELNKAWIGHRQGLKSSNQEGFEGRQCCSSKMNQDYRGSRKRRRGSKETMGAGIWGLATGSYAGLFEMPVVVSDGGGEGGI